MSYSISDNGIKLICDFEGFVPHPYRDQVGYPTIGYGTRYYPNGNEVTMGDPIITKEDAIRFLKFEVNKKAIPTIEKYVRVPLNQNQVDSLCSFIYNLGSGALIGGHILVKINTNAPCADVQTEFKKWVYADHKVLPDLVRRRAKEADLYCQH